VPRSEYIVLDRNSRKIRPMENRELLIGERKKIALVAHDNKKRDLLEGSKFNNYGTSENRNRK
jgi:hypothetical protein